MAGKTAIEIGRTSVLLLALLWTHWIGFSYGDGTPKFSDFYFVVEPENTVAVRGHPALLNCSAHHNGERPHMQWIRDGVFMNFGGDTRRHKLDNGSLYFTQIVHSRTHRPDEGKYQCVASLNGFGTIVSRSARLEVAYLARNFDVEPQNLVIHLGDTAMFGCIIGGSPKRNVTWYREERELSEDQNINYKIHPEGVLEISSVEFRDIGRYKCQVGNIERVRWSGFADLSQNSDPSSYKGVPPSFIMKPMDRTVLEGETTMMFCGANGRDRTEAPPKIQWLKDGITIDMSNLDSRFSISGQGSLRIETVKEEDSGTYTCRATNMEDSEDAVATLTVHVPPTFRKRPENKYAHVNADITFECDIYGVPKPTITWMKNGDIVIPSDYFQIVDGRDLRILGLVNSDDGLYQCIGDNQVGNIQASAQLVILQPGSINMEDENLPSTPRNLVAAIVSTRFVTLSWRVPAQEGSALVTVYSVYWKEEGSDRERVLNTTTTEANIQHLKPATTYEFKVLAYNRMGPGKGKATIQVETQPEVHVPSPPMNLRAMALSPTSVKVEWDPPAQPNGVITNYKLYSYEVGANKENQVDVTGTVHQLTDLKTHAEYSFRVVAFNANGAGMSTEESVARTFSDVPSDVPQNVTIETASSTSIIVRWEPPPEDQQNGIITGYKIRYKRVTKRKGDTVTTDGNRRLYALTDLVKGEEYMIRISAQTVNGSGPATDWFKVETFLHDLDESVVPGQPSSLRVRPLTTSIVVSWTPPAEQNVMIRGYTIGYGIGIPDVYKQVLDAKQRYFTIRNLRASSEYVISLRAFNNIGDGRPIYETVITREETTPEPMTPMIPPVGLKAIVLSATTIVVTWSDTTLGRNQRITDNRFYTIKYHPKGHTRKPKQVNSTDLNAHIDDLKPNMEYEFSVKVLKGRRHSTWSLSVFNRTSEAAPASAPRDLTPVALREKPTLVTLNWQPPKLPNGQITGYLVFYTTNNKQTDREWVVEGVLGDKLSAGIRELTPDTTYYFKVQARNRKGYGPMSPTVIFRTPLADGSGGGKIETPVGPYVPPINDNKTQDGKTGASATGGISNTILIIIVCVAGVSFIAIVVVTVIVCRRTVYDNDRKKRKSGAYKPGSKSKGTKGGVKDVKPPDLWIHHDHMELKSVKNRNDGSGRQGDAQEMKPLNDDSPDSQYDSHDDDRYRRPIRPKPIMIPVDSQPNPPREPIATATALPNGHILGRDEPPGIPTRPVYPRTQYNTQYGNTPRVHAGDLSQPSSGCVSPIPVKPQQSQPTSPYKKPNPPTATTPFKPRSPLPVVTPRAPDVTMKSTHEGETELQKSYSAEELSAEMANLEGLMKDLNAITQSEFEC